MSVNRRAAATDNKKTDWLPYFVGALTVAVLFSFLLYPIGKSVLSSFVASGDPLTMANLTWINFEKFFNSTLYKNALLNSLTIAVTVTIIATVLALPAAYALSRISMPFRSLLLSLSVIPLISPPFIGAYSWVTLFGKSGIVSHYLRTYTGIEMPSIYGPFGIVLALSLSYFPYVLLIVQGALSAADPFIEENASIMGASQARILRTITLPLILPSIAAGAIIVFIKALGNFGVPAILGADYYVLPTLIYFQVNG